MGILSWIVLGLVAGVLAKHIMPDKDGSGFIYTTILGVLGAFLGGWLGSFLGLGSIDGLNVLTVLTATLGAVVLLFFGRLMQK